jgi:hypothetical protein
MWMEATLDALQWLVNELHASLEANCEAAAGVAVEELAVVCAEDSDEEDLEVQAIHERIEATKKSQDGWGMLSTLLKFARVAHWLDHCSQKLHTHAKLCCVLCSNDKPLKGVTHASMDGCLYIDYARTYRPTSSSPRPCGHGL